MDVERVAGDTVEHKMLTTSGVIYTQMKKRLCDIRSKFAELNASHSHTSFLKHS